MRTQFIQAIFVTSLLTLTACGGAETTMAPDPVTAPDTAAEVPVCDDSAAAEAATDAAACTDPETAGAATTDSPTAAADHSAPTKGGQVVETGAYHMEFVPIPEADGIHLDFYLQTGDTHEPVTDATVVAQVQLPDGTQQAIPMEYDAAGEHFFAFVPSQATGEYKTVIQTDIQGEKVNGRFSFSK